MASAGGGDRGNVGRTLLLAWDVSAVQEKPWLAASAGAFVRSPRGGGTWNRRRPGRLGRAAWLVPKRSGGGVAVVYFEALDPERVLGELAASEAPFDSWYSGAMRKIFGFDLARLPRAGSSELLFTWREDRGPGEREAPKSPCPNTSAR